MGFATNEGRLSGGARGDARCGRGDAGEVLNKSGALGESIGTGNGKMKNELVVDTNMSVAAGAATGEEQ